MAICVLYSLKAHDCLILATYIFSRLCLKNLEDMGSVGKGETCRLVGWVIKSSTPQLHTDFYEIIHPSKYVTS